MIREAFLGFFAGTLAIGVIVRVLLWRPLFGPWIRKRQGLADVRQAKQSRQILVEQASAEREAARERAGAIPIVDKAAQTDPEYRQHEIIGAFAEALIRGQIAQIIYVPTEGNLPILEATRPIAE
ncbi:MAG: hypothetical protein AAFR47_06440 [Pseudomonadota bacterium]